MVKNNFEIDVKVKCIENGTTQAQIAKDIHTSKEYVNKVIKKQEGIVYLIYVKSSRAFTYYQVGFYVKRTED